MFRMYGLKSYVVVLFLAVLGGAAAPVWSAEDAAPGRKPKLREVADIPEDYLGKTFTYKVRISTNQHWMHRAGNFFFLFVQDAEGNKLPNNGFSPESTVNIIRFMLSKEEGRKLIDRLNASQTYEARIRFTIDREPALLGQGWSYLAKIGAIELP